MKAKVIAAAMLVLAFVCLGVAVHLSLKESQKFPDIIAEQPILQK